MKKLFITFLALTILTSAVYAKTKERKLIKDNRLTTAVIDNDVKKVKKLLKKGSDPNYTATLPCGPKDFGYMGPKTCAIIRENAEILQVLIDSGADFKKCYYAGIAIRQGNKEILELLLDAGTPSDCYYINALENKEIAQMLAARVGADKVKEQDTYFQFFNAVKNNDIPGMQEGIKAGISANAEYPFNNCLGYRQSCQVPDFSKGTLPLMIAEQDKTVKFLVQAGADPNTKGGYNKETALMHANSADMVNFLIKAGADVNARDIQEHTVLMRQLGRAAGIAILNALIKNGADITAKSKGVPTLAYAQNAATVNLLVKVGAKVDERDNENKTVLMRKIFYTPYGQAIDLDLIIALIKNGADVNATTGFWNVLSFAIKRKDRKLVSLLEDVYGAKLQTEDPRVVAEYNTLMGKNVSTQQTKQEGVGSTLLKDLDNVGAAVTGMLVDQKTGTNLGSMAISAIDNKPTTDANGTCKWHDLDLPADACNKCVNNKPLNQYACSACCNSIGKYGLRSNKYYATDPAAGTKSAGYFKPGCYCSYSDGKDYVF